MRRGRVPRADPPRAAEYEEVRTSPSRFALAPGHPHEGRVVEERDGYVIVEETGAGAKVALESDLRSDDA